MHRSRAPALHPFWPALSARQATVAIVQPLALSLAMQAVERQERAGRPAVRAGSANLSDWPGTPEDAEVNFLPQDCWSLVTLACNVDFRSLVTLAS